MHECEQVLFPDKLFVSNNGIVHTPTISPIYSLLKAKSSPKAAKNAYMVELAGTAPASAGLSVLIVYRNSPFFNLKR